MSRDFAGVLLYGKLYTLVKKVGRGSELIEGDFKMRKRIIVLLMILAIVFSTVDYSLAAKKGNIRIGVSVMTMQYPFFRDIVAGIRSKAGKKVTLNVNDANLNLQTQISAVENFVAQEVDAIILNAVDGNGISSALDAAKKARIPVITVDMRPVKGTFVTYIGSDNKLGGKLAGKYAVNCISKNIKGDVKVVLFMNPLSSASVERIDGFKEVIQKAGNVKIVAEKGADTREKFMAAMEDILIAHPDVNMVFSYSAQGGLGAYDAIVSAGKQDRVAVIGFDATDEEVKEIKKGGAYKASVIQFPKLLGEMCLDSALKVINGKKIPKDIAVEVGLYTKDRILKAADLK
jgi:ribose transport system substrate-binding protein